MRSTSGDAIPLTALVTTRLDAEPRSLNQLNGFNTTTLSLVMMPGVSMQEALDCLDGLQRKMLPPGFSVDYSDVTAIGKHAGHRVPVAGAGDPFASRCARCDCGRA